MRLMGAQMKSSSGQGPKRSGVGWVTVATAHARPPPARLLTRMRSVPASGLQGDGANNALLPGIPTRSDVRVAKFRAAWF